MQINKLYIEGFRNYGAQEIAFDGKSNVIFGENAQGKTNLLEALFYLSCGRSPRARTDRELIGFEKQNARLKAAVESREREFTVQIDLQRGKRRQCTINGVPAKTAAALSDVLHTVFFAPEDLYLIRDGAAARRRVMDDSLCQLRPRYAAALAEYSRLYEHKTRILRDSGEHPSLIDALPDFNERLCQTGAALIYYRARFCRSLSDYAARAHRECSGEREELEAQYRTVSTVEDPFAPPEELADCLRRHQKEHYEAEIASRLCLSGPHKDEIEVSVNGRSARQFCSQGQVRTAALSLKLAEREIHKNALGEYPVMLLDDVFSELDARRQEYVLNRISGGQVFITCCESDRLDALLRGKILHVRNGEVF
ncbi:MAG: DNA replication/repair protein RecF [Oscillospiraceae bacterium]|nr:DNA replication/repair protein RecF [Oscillospiraceae bacterium]